MFRTLADTPVRYWSRGTDWGYFVLDDASGLVTINSDFGVYSHIWRPEHRSEPLLPFLAHLGFDYFMTKARPKDWQIIDTDAMTRQVMRDVRLAMHSKDISARDARDGFRHAQDCLYSGYQTLSEWYEALAQEPALSGFLDHYEPVCQYNPECVNFWQRIWRPAITNLVMPEAA